MVTQDCLPPAATHNLHTHGLALLLLLRLPHRDYFGWKQPSADTAHADRTAARELNRTHFVLGDDHDEPMRSTAALAGAAGGVIDPDELLASRQAATARVQALQRTSVEFGSHPTEYSTTNHMPAPVGAEIVKPLKVDTYSHSIKHGDADITWQTTNMAATGQTQARTSRAGADIPLPKGTWKKMMTGEIQPRMRKW